MKQDKVNTIAGLVSQGGVLVGAATQLGVALGLHHNDKDKINADLTELIMAVGNHEQAKADLYDRRTALKIAAKDAQTHLRKGRDVLKPVFGYTYSDVWTIMGYNDSLEVTDRPEDQQAMLQAQRTYYTNHPTFEVPLLNLTAAYTDTVIQTLTAAQQAVSSQEGAVEAAMNVRDEKAKQMRRRVSSLFSELTELLEPMDARWLNFGFNLPGAEQTPETPLNFKATLIGPTAVALKWDAAERASYYRVWKKVSGVDEDYVPVGTPGDLDFTIEDLPANSTVEIQVSAVNTGGESSRSASVTVVMHA